MSTGTSGKLGKAVAQHGVALARAVVGIGDEQHHRHDRPAPRLGAEIDLLHHREEPLEQRVAEVDHLRHVVRHDELVEQRHLAAGVADAGGGGVGRQVVEQRELVRD